MDVVDQKGENRHQHISSPTFVTNIDVTDWLSFQEIGPNQHPNWMSFQGFANKGKYEKLYFIISIGDIS